MGLPKPRFRRLTPLALLLAQFAIPAAGIAQQSIDVAPVPPGVRPANATRLGALSCAATACHGSVTRDQRPGNIWRNEYVHWIENDPHASAHDTLSSRRSRTMLAKLKIEANPNNAGYQNCLACHDPSQTATLGGTNDYVGLGVDCESCHGPASDWLADHYLPSFERAASSMSDTKDLAARAELCSKCHVGDVDRQVNHDLIAAGHPALKFEFSAYHDMLPKHWNDVNERRTTPNFETQLWTHGQVAAVKASLSMLAAQAKQANAESGAVWPEYSHYDCYACHHDLTASSWRQRSIGARKPGTLPWGSWYFATFGAVNDSPAVTKAFDDLRGVMQASYRPDPTSAAKSADNALSILQSAPRVASEDLLRKSLVESSPNITNWDAAAQTYLLIVALHQTSLDRGETNKELSNSIKKLRTQLAFPDGFESPRNFIGANDADDQPHQVQSTIDSILQHWKQRSGATP